MDEIFMKLSSIYGFFFFSLVACFLSWGREGVAGVKLPIPQQLVVSAAPFYSVEEAMLAGDSFDETFSSNQMDAIRTVYAAKEIREHLLLLGIEAEIVSPTDKREGPAFILGVLGDERTDPPVSKKALKSIAALGPQGYAIIPKNRNLYISSSSSIGTLYGAYRVLEYLGFAWYEMHETHVPRGLTSKERVRWRQIKEKPRIRFRGFWIPQGDSDVMPDEYAVWMARNKLNLGGVVANPVLQRKLGIFGWAGGHKLLQQEFSAPEIFREHPDWFSTIGGKTIPVSAMSKQYVNPKFASREAALFFANRMIDRLENGDLQHVSLLNVWPSDGIALWDESPEANALGNNSDNLLYFYSIVAARLDEAWASGELSRPVTLCGISYNDTFPPPTNLEVVAKLEHLNYIHVFYPNERSWAGVLDSNLDVRSSNEFIVHCLDQWLKVANFPMGIVNSYNLTNYSGVAITDFEYFADNFAIQTSGREELFAYMHPLLNNPGPRNLTNALLAKLGWINTKKDNLTKKLKTSAKKIIRRYFARRYSQRGRKYDFLARRWRLIYRLMSRSVENAKELYLRNSLTWLLYRQHINSPKYSVDEVFEFIDQYRNGGVQPVPPSPFSAYDYDLAMFRGLDKSLKLQRKAERLWKKSLTKDIPDDVRARDIEWFEATLSRYKLLDLSCEYYKIVNRNPPSNKQWADYLYNAILDEIDFLKTSPVTDDTVSPLIDQRKVFSKPEHLHYNN